MYDKSPFPLLEATVTALSEMHRGLQDDQANAAPGAAQRDALAVTVGEATGAAGGSQTPHGRKRLSTSESKAVDAKRKKLISKWQRHTCMTILEGPMD